MNDLDLEKQVSDYIDALNAEYSLKNVMELRYSEMEKLLATVG